MGREGKKGGGKRPGQQGMGKGEQTWKREREEGNVGCGAVASLPSKITPLTP